MKATIGILALIAGFCYLSAASPPADSHNNKTLAATTETKSPPPILSMADVLASPDLLVAMGQVAARDSYHIREKLKRDGYPIIDRLKLDPVEVDEKLTAEQVFAINSKDDPNIGLYGIKDPPIDARRLSRSETLKLQGLVRIHSMASLALYKKRCGYSHSLELNVITSQFAELPQQRQDSALDHETTAIEARGGWSWFCSVVHDHIVRHSFFEEMFTTAMEMRS